MFRRFVLVFVIATFPVSSAYAQATQPTPHRHHRTREPSSPATRPAQDEARESSEGKAVAQAGPAAEGVIEDAAVTEHEVNARGGPLKYTATTAKMLMKDEEGKTRARMFFVAYEKQQVPDSDLSSRPVTFVFNGGPGAAAVWLHLGAAGPYRIELTPEGEVPPPPHRVVENSCTWLHATDLVFIDPVGTGFSRPEKGEKAEQFYGVSADISSVADFIRLYITRYQRWNSPLFLAGESYGTTRAAGLSEHLLEKQGIALNGIILISSVLDFSTLSPGDGNDLPYALYLPSYTAAAWYHRRLGPDLQADLETTLRRAEEWAAGDYLVALGRGDALSPEARRVVVEHLARFTSLPPRLIERANLRIGAGLFQKHLLADESRLIGRFDARITGYDSDPLSNRPDYDPSLARYLPVYTSAFNDYVRRKLNFESTLAYEVLSGRVHPWKYGEAGTGYLYVADDLRSAMIKNPYLRVMFASGWFDLATPYFATVYTIDHMELSPELRVNITEKHYLGGHMMYHYAPSLEKLRDDVTAFIESAVAQPAAPAGKRPG